MYRVKARMKKAHSGWTGLYFSDFINREKAVTFAKKAYLELYNQVFYMEYGKVGDITEEVDEQNGKFYAHTYACGPEISVEMLEI